MAKFAISATAIVNAWILVEADNERDAITFAANFAADSVEWSFDLTDPKFEDFEATEQEP